MSANFHDQVSSYLASGPHADAACAAAFLGLGRAPDSTAAGIPDAPGLGALSPRACRLLGTVLDNRIRLDRNDDYANPARVDALFSSGLPSPAERHLAAVLAIQFRARHAQRKSPYSKEIRADLLAASFRLARHAGAAHDQATYAMALDAIPPLLAFARHLQRHLPPAAWDLGWLTRLCSDCGARAASRRHAAAVVLPAIQQDCALTPVGDVPEVAKAILAGLFDLRSNGHGHWSITRPMRSQQARLASIDGRYPQASASLLRLALAALTRPALLPVHDQRTLAEWAQPLPRAWDASACRAARAVLQGRPWRLALASDEGPLPEAARAWDAALSMTMAQEALSAQASRRPRRRA